MKKFLLTLFAVCMAAISYAQVDTVYFVPGQVGDYKIEVDTVEYPYLKDVTVNWYCGFGDLEVDFQDQGKHVVCAQKVPKESIITMEDGSKHLHMEEIPEVWNPWQDVRTVTVFYTHKIDTKTSVTDEYGTFLSRDEFEGFTCDTVAILHIQKELEQSDVTSFQVNGLDADIIEIESGDTAKFTSKVLNDLDVQNYALIVNEQPIAVSDTGYIALVPEENIEDIQLLISNKVGELLLPWKKTIKVYPKFEVTNMIYSTSANGKTTIVENPNMTELEVNVTNGDSITLCVETNSALTINTPKVTYNWNKDGKTLPEGMKVEKGKLIIPEYTKPDMDGVYNCLVAANDTIITTSFKIKSDFATSNESLSFSEVVVASNSGNIVLSNVHSKSIRVVNLLGQTIYNDVAKSSTIYIPVRQGVYLVTVEGKTYKIVSK